MADLHSVSIKKCLNGYQIIWRFGSLKTKSKQNFGDMLIRFDNFTWLYG